jgi:hypothetical protein
MKFCSYRNIRKRVSGLPGVSTQLDDHDTE